MKGKEWRRWEHVLYPTTNLLHAFVELAREDGWMDVMVFFSDGLEGWLI